jgi:predicted TIM-barrel fold metal-dependent hydrolase
MIVRDTRTGKSYINESASEFGYRSEISDLWWDIPSRLRVMDNLGIDVQLLSVGNPWLSYIPASESKRFSRILNKELMTTAKNYPTRFAVLGILPVSSSEAIEELDYAVNELGVKGFMIGTHVNGRSIVCDEFLPIFERASKLKIPIYIHPLARPDVSRYYDRSTTASLIFPTETALIAKEIVEKEIFVKYPNCSLVLPHLGGTVPFSLGRLFRNFQSRKESDILGSLKKFYLDSISYYTPAFEYAAGIWGPEKIMFGTDFPHIWSDDHSHTIETIVNSKLTDKQKNLVLGENAVRFFSL